MNFVSIQLNKADIQPLYLQLFYQIRDMIMDSGKKNEKLPPIRDAARLLNVNTSTVIHAYRLLEENGYISSKKGSGCYIIYEKPRGSLSVAYENRAEIDFANATPNPDVFPTESFKECIDAVLDRDRGFAFGYQESNGYPPLREAICSVLKDSGNIYAAPENMIIVSGAQQGIDIVAKSLLNAGDYVLAETPTYDGARMVFESRGSHVAGFRLENDGPDMEDLEKKIRLYKPKLLYLMTKFQNPTTISYSKEKLQEILVLAQKYNFFIAEEDSMSELAYSDTIYPFPMKTLDKYGRVVYVKSFSKLLMPGLRLAFATVPENLSLKFAQAKHATDISSSGLIQRALDLYMRSGKWQEHINYMKEIYRGKYEVLLAGLKDLPAISFNPPQGGLFFWAKLSKEIPANELCRLCMEKGLSMLSSEMFFSRPSHENAVRISFAYPDIGQIKKGVHILSEMMNNVINKNVT